MQGRKTQESARGCSRGGRGLRLHLRIWHRAGHVAVPGKDLLSGWVNREKVDLCEMTLAVEMGEGTLVLPREPTGPVIHLA